MKLATYIHRASGRCWKCKVRGQRSRSHVTVETYITTVRHRGSHSHRPVWILDKACSTAKHALINCCWWRNNQQYISDLLTSVANIPGRSTLHASSCVNLVVPRTRRRIGDRAFSVAAPQAWNRLPMELKLLRSTDSFRRDLKTFLFHSVYVHQDTDWLCDAPSVF